MIEEQSINGVDLNSPELPQLANKARGTLVILGGGRSVWEDYEFLEDFIGHHQIMCINDIAIQFHKKRIQHVVSLHKEWLHGAKILRKVNTSSETFITHGLEKAEGVDVVWDMQNSGGTSAFFAVRVALVMGYRKICICGVPLDNNAHYFDHVNKKNHNSTKNEHSWMNLFSDNEYAQKRIRSVSGKTAKIFGVPTKEWIEERS